MIVSLQLQFKKNAINVNTEVTWKHACIVLSVVK